MSKNVRLTTKYKNLSDKFLLQSWDYQKQFSHLYAFRLAEMTKLLATKSREKWGSEYSIKKLSELRDDTKEKCIIIGTIFKHQVYKPSILREISEENQLAPQPPHQHYADPEDKLILEDELQRVRLFGKVNVQTMATGIVCAALGRIQENGTFEVEDLIYYESGPQKPLGAKDPAEEHRYLILVSDLNQAESQNFAESLNLLQHWFSGNLICGGIGAHQLVRLIVAGNSVRSNAEQRASGLQTCPKEQFNILECIKQLDDWFHSWSKTIPIDLMPGEFDPSNFMLPQQPFHRCMFQKAAKNTLFSSVPNPYACEIDGDLIVGSSGQNIKDILRTTLITEPLEALRSTLIWSHIAPTSPDTIGCYPYIDTDPFILHDCPHVYFTANCGEFKTDMHIGSTGNHTRLVCVPSFAKTQCIAAVNLNTLECRKISFLTT